MMKHKNHYLTRILALMMISGAFWLSSCSDDEENPVPTIIQFGSETASVSEDNADGVDVAINFDRAIQIPGTFEIEVGGTAVAGEDYTISPTATNNIIALNAEAGNEGAVVEITPIDNSTYQGSRTVTLTLKNADGVQLGTTQTITVTISDDEQAPTSIADIRAMYTGAGVSIEEDKIIEGVVISEKSNITGKNIVVQDETNGIVVRFNEDNTSFDLGDAVRINLNGGTLDAFNGLVQVSGLELSSVMEIGTGEITPEEITMTELLSGEYQSRLITVSNVAFDDANGTATFEGFGTATFSGDGESAETFIRGGSLLEGEVIPVGVGSITGIPSEFSGTIELILRDMDDLNITESADISVEGTVSDFGAINNGDWSTSQVVTLNATDLFSVVSIETSPNFWVSNDNQLFTNNLMIFEEDAEAGVQIYIRFEPISGTNQVINGEIVFKSFGAAPEVISVTGEEIGNTAGGGTPGLFISEYAEGSSNNKYVEIYNPTANAIDLADYQLWGSNNGGDWKAERKLQLTGTIQPGDVFIIATDESDPAILAEADMAMPYESPVHHNGDDAIGLFKTDGAGGFTLLDVIGVPTIDPGSGWEVAGVADGTKEHTLVRKASVISGNTDWSASAGTDAASSEWTVLDQNDWSDLGSHTAN